MVCSGLRVALPALTPDLDRKDIAVLRGADRQP